MSKVFHSISPPVTVGNVVAVEYLDIRAGPGTPVDTRAIGVAIVTLGGGRIRPQDPIDHAVGVTGLQPIGARMEQGEPIAFVHARSHDDAVAAAQVIEAAYGFSERKPRTVNPVFRRIGA